jgi:hypothetical protein
MGSRWRLTSVRRGIRSSARRQTARLEVHTISSPGIATRRGGNKLAGMAGLCRNTAGQPARSADFADAIYRPKPAATMISSQAWGHRPKRADRRQFPGKARRPFRAIGAAIWVGFNQIGLGMAKVLAHKKRRRQGADRASGRGVCAVAHHH